MSLSKAILLYDGYCNFCIRIVRILEFLNFYSFTPAKLIMRPYQKSPNLIRNFSIDPKLVDKKIHLIDLTGKIYKGNEAAYRLGTYFPLLKPLTIFFKTSLGKNIYKLTAKNRRKIFGCSDSCYISKAA